MKKAVSYNHLFLMTATLLTIASCGENKNKGGSNTGFVVNQSVSAVRDLTAAERTIATRICYAYQSKNSSLRTQTYYGGTFNFSVNTKSCSLANENYLVSGVLTTAPDGSLIFDSKTTKSFNNKVQTSQTGFLSQLCSKIVNNLPVSNTAVVNNVTVQVAFLTSDLDTYVLNYFTSQNNVLKITSADTFKVRTQFNQSPGQILGMDESYTKQSVCSDNKTFSQATQNFTGFTVL